jgi:hypothetical protein
VWCFNCRISFCCGKIKRTEKEDNSFCGYELKTLDQSFVLIVEIIISCNVPSKLVTTQFTNSFYAIKRLKFTDKEAHFDLGIFPEQIVTSSVRSRSGSKQSGW